VPDNLGSDAQNAIIILHNRECEIWFQTNKLCEFLANDGYSEDDVYSDRELIPGNSYSESSCQYWA